MNSRLLVASIVSSGALLGFLNYKLKPGLDEKQLSQISGRMAATAQWQGQIAPDFELQTTGGERFRLSENIGKKMIVLNFFATWCGPCREEMPELNRYFNEHRAESFYLIGVDSDEKPDVVKGFVDEMKVDFPIAIDSGPVQGQYGVTAFPTTVIIGVDGKVEFYEAGGIANPEVAFDNFLRLNRKLMEAGAVISPENYRRESQQHPALGSGKGSTVSAPPEPSSDDEGFQLDARGRRIVARMGCPCGCAKTVQTCVCATSKNIRKALATENFHDLPGDQIIRGLNNRFCSGPM
jgi:peroxiredoxin